MRVEVVIMANSVRVEFRHHCSKGKEQELGEGS